jgi:hypothetical protein
MVIDNSFGTMAIDKKRNQWLSTVNGVYIGFNETNNKFNNIRTRYRKFANFKCENGCGRHQKSIVDRNDKRIAGFAQRDSFQTEEPVT